MAESDNPFDKYKSEAPVTTDDNPFAKYVPAGRGGGEDPGLLESFGRGALSGAMFGFEDEAGVADKYRQARSRAANPWTHFAGEIAGGLAPMAAAAVLPTGAGQAAAAGRAASLAARGAGLVRRALVPGEIGTLAQAAGQGAKLGAVYGGLSGAGHADPSSSDTLADAAIKRTIGAAQGAGTGVLIGAPTGGALHGASRALGSGLNRMLPDLAELRAAAQTPELQGIRDLVRQAGYDNYTMDDFAALAQRLRDPAHAHRYEGLNIIEALEARPPVPTGPAGELRPPAVVSPSLREYAQDMANTAGTGRHAAAEAYATRQNEMSARIQNDIDRLFGSAPPSTADDAARIGATLDRVTGSGDRAAAEARRLAQQKAFNARYEKLREQPLVLTEGLGDTIHIPQMQRAIAYAAENDMINAPAGASWGKTWAQWSRAAAENFDTPVPGITLSPSNIIDIHHVLAANARPRVGADPAMQMQAGDLKRRFAEWVNGKLKGHKDLTKDYAVFKRALEAEDMGAALPLIAGGRNHPSMAFIRGVNSEVDAAGRDVQKTFAASDRSLDAWRAGTGTKAPTRKNAPKLEALQKATNRLESFMEVQENFRRAWGEAIKEQLSRTADPAQVASLVRQALTPAGRERIREVLGQQRAVGLIQELLVMDARNHGLALGFARGGGDGPALQFLNQMRRDGNLSAIDAFRRGWGESIRRSLGAATSPTQVAAVVKQLLTMEGKSRILRLLGPQQGREFIESLYNKATQAYFGSTLYGNSNTAYKMARHKKAEEMSNAISALMPWSFRPLQALGALRSMASGAFAQRRADQGNALLARQGPAEVGAVLDTILARNQLRTAGHPYLARPAVPVIGPSAAAVPSYQQQQRAEPRRRP
jgi:hypothetical protein